MTRTWWLLVVLTTGLCAAAEAQVVSGMGDLPSEERAELLPDELEAPSAIDWRTGTYGPVRPEAARENPALRPFGANLWNGGFRGPRASGLNPNYRILPGDRVTLRTWGAVEMNTVLPVDAQGNIFVPSVGPVPVLGATSEELDARVKAAIREVYTDNLSVYTNLQGVQPVAVFVTGFVESPGRYAGNPRDSVLYFLDQASGITDASGSYRNVRVLRDGTPIAEVDLYDFLREGILPRPQFQDGDTIVVGARGPVVAVEGDVAEPFHYELTGGSLSGADLLELADLKPGVTHALLRGVRDDGPISLYLTLADFRDAAIQAGDEVLFSADQRPDTIVVQVEGSFEGPSRFAVPKDATLMQLLDSIPVDPRLADLESISIRRVSVAERQRQSLEDSLRRLETTYLGASSATAEEASIRATEAKLIQDFVKRARQVQPTGRMVVAKNGRITDIRLQDGDVITIPERSDSLLISGEVLIPQAVVYTEDQRLRDYIERAGGFTERADRSRVLIVRRNGEVVPARGAELRAGDEILVLPEAPVKNLQLASTLAQIVYQIAIATNVAINI
ncbi:MAG TPA: polysaccharide biosynthesis/export family protein [Pseudomonadales bacterium]